MAEPQPGPGKEPERPLRVMADANILIAGILFPPWFHEFLRHALAGDFKLVLSAQTIREARERMAQGTVAQQRALEQFLTDCGDEAVSNPSPEEVREHAVLVCDLKDIPIALAAIQAKVDYLVSNDKDLTAQDETTAVLREKIKPLIAGWAEILPGKPTTRIRSGCFCQPFDLDDSF